MNAVPSVKVIESEAYGTIEVSQEQIYRFPQGIVGLPEVEEYALIPYGDSPLHILHALTEQLSFILIPAHQAVEDYGFAIDQTVIDLLQVRAPEEVATFLVMNIVDDRPYVNLKAPVLLAPHSNTGCQFIIDDQHLPLRHPLFSEEGP